jgi:acetolactate synthase-1/2/3 large subunit
MPFMLSSPGSEWSPVWEAMARQTVEKNDGPKFMDCLHETIAVDIAMGYTSVTGKPLAVLLHAGVGLMHGSMACCLRRKPRSQC